MIQKDNNKIFINKNELNILYNEKKLTIEECACIFNCSNSTIIRNLEEFGFYIKKRIKYESIITKDRLYDLYINNHTSERKISKELNTSRGIVRGLLKKYKIQERRKDYHDYNITKEWLYDCYINKKMAADKISKLKNCSKRVILKLLNKFNIPKRKQPDYYEWNKILDEIKLKDVYLSKPYKTKKQCAQILGCKKTTLEYYLKKHRICRGNQKTTVEKQNKIIQSYNNGLSIDECAIKFNMTHYLIDKILKNNNVIKRSKQLKIEIPINMIEYIKNEYLNGKSSIKISKDIGLNKHKILKILKYYKITRTNIDAQRNRDKSTYYNVLDINIDLLRKMYIDEKQTRFKCALFFKCTPQHITYLLEKNNIYVRSSGETRSMHWNVEFIEKEKLLDLYLNKMYSLKTIANMANCSDGTIKSKLINYGVEIRHDNPGAVNYNKMACEFFNEINLMFGLSGFHAENLGEFCVNPPGFWLDYYDPSLNLVIEWDEKFHYDSYGKLRDSDIKRQKQITTRLGCLFLRISQDNKEQDCLFVKEQIKSLISKNNIISNIMGA